MLFYKFDDAVWRVCELSVNVLLQVFESLECSCLYNLFLSEHDWIENPGGARDAYEILCEVARVHGVVVDVYDEEHDFVVGVLFYKDRGLVYPQLRVVGNSCP